MPRFQLAIPKKLEGVDSLLLNPRNTWKDKDAYDKQATQLIEHFINNFKKFTTVSEKIRQAEPVL